MLNHNSVLHSFMLKMYLKIKQQRQQKENVLTEQCHSEVSPLKVRESHHQLETPQSTEFLHGEQPFFSLSLSVSVLYNNRKKGIAQE